MILPETIYRTNHDLKVTGTIHFSKPYSQGFHFTIPAGESFKVSVWTDSDDSTIQIWLTNFQKYESQIVDGETLSSPFYDSFSLTIERKVLEDNCELITDFKEAIYFYSAKDRYGEFSNFAEYGIEHDNFYYPTIEHFYQSQKFSDSSYSELIRNAKTAKDAAKLGQSRERKIRDDWEDIKTDVMTLAVQKKIDTHDSIKELLLLTNDKLLIENSPYDNYWGIGQTGEGFNYLGTILMRIRGLIKNAT